jgi:hypothetical protein
MGTWVVGFAGRALLYALGLSLAILLAARLLGRFPGWRVLPLLFATLTFVFLTQHPFPAPGDLDCPVPSAAPQLHLFDFRATFARLHDRGAGPLEWLRNRTVAATVMNFLVCGVIGAVLARHTGRLAVALWFGAGLTLAVELTQLTGIWGLYPCAYRQFNVDDLMLNALGVVVGFLLARGLSGRRTR